MTPLSTTTGKCLGGHALLHEQPGCVRPAGARPARHGSGARRFDGAACRDDRSAGGNSDCDANADGDGDADADDGDSNTDCRCKASSVRLKLAVVC